MSPAHEHLSYVAQGRYAAMLERWYAAFPRDQVLVLMNEDFDRDPDEVLGSALRFPRVASVGASTARAVQLPPRPLRWLRRRGRELVERFREDNRKLDPSSGREPERMGGMTREGRAEGRRSGRFVRPSVGWPGCCGDPARASRSVGAGFDAPTGSERFALVGGPTSRAS